MKYCPIDKVPELRGELTDSYRRIARNVYVSKKGYLVKYYHGGKMHEKKFSCAEDVVKEYL